MSMKQKGIIIALILGVLMLILPDGKRFRYTVNPEKMGELIYGGKGWIGAEDIAERLKADIKSVNVIDIREMRDYDSGSIRGAVHIPVKLLLTGMIIEEKLDNKKLNVLLCNDGSTSIQAWMVLHAGGMRVFALKGGFNEWKGRIKDISLYDGMDEEALKNAAAITSSSSVPKKKTAPVIKAAPASEGC